MPKYKVLERSYIGERLVEKDELVEYDGKPGNNLEPTDAEGRRAAKEFAEEREQLALSQAAMRGFAANVSAEFARGAFAAPSAKTAPGPTAMEHLVKTRGEHVMADKGALKVR